MDFELNNALPIRKQLADQLKERIVIGEYSPGSHLYSALMMFAVRYVLKNRLNLE